MMSNQKNLISFPRSGQHMLERTIRDFHRKFNILPYKYCEFYNCCRQHTCKYNANYQKNHDFDLKLNIRDDQKYVYLYRKNKIEQLESYYRCDIGKPVDYNNQEDYNNLIDFCKKKSKYYDGLKQKYVDTKRDNVLSVDYDEFLGNPAGIFYKIISFFGFNYTENEISQFINERNETIEKKNRLDYALLCKISNDTNIKI